MHTWNIDPVLLEIGPIQIRWYGLLFLSGFLIGYQGMQWIFKKEGYSESKLDPLLYYLLGGTVLGARLGHCFLYEPEYFLSHPLEIPMVWHGGLASHGGIVGIIIALWVFTYRNKEFKFMWIADRISIFTAITGGFIRLGNLMNSEILGKPVSWGIVFQRVDTIPRHPAQVYESVSYFLLGILLFQLYRKYKHKPPSGLLFGISMVSVFTIRFVIEFFKENQEPFERGMALNMGQLLSIPMVLGGIVFVYLALARKKAIPEG